MATPCLSATLRQSILKAAFSGQLVPQDPADEPASVLLARIKAGHAGGKRHGTGKQEDEHLEQITMRLE